MSILRFPSSTAGWLLCSLVVASSSLPLSAQAEQPKADAKKPADQPAAVPLGKAATESVNARYESAKHWVQKVVSILSLNDHWHPVGVTTILSALRDSDARLRAFAVEALLRCDATLPPSLASTELVNELVTKQLSNKNSLYRERVVSVLQRIAPKADAVTKPQWAKWWRANAEGWKPAPWKGKELDPANSHTVTTVADRAFDLSTAGLELAICIDSTGSMQPTIDALAEALGDMVGILRGLSPKFRLGIAHYKDRGELGKSGAKIVTPLIKNVATARKKLLKINAHGGGDIPEAVLGGLQLALSSKMKWQPDANKVVIIIGDAPPHDADRSDAIDLAKSAREAPESVGKKRGRPTTGSRSKKPAPKAYITSAIGVFLKPNAAMRSHPAFPQFEKGQKQMRTSFEQIADAGGGVFVEVEFEARGPLTSKEKRRLKGKTAGVAAKATRNIVEHILVLSFGSRFAREMKAFVRIFYDYKAAGLFK